jgi:hypothetical protein
MALGESQTIIVTLTATNRLENVNLWVVPALSEFVEIDTTPFSLDIGEDKDFNLTLNATRTGFYDGTIHVQSGSSTVPATLKIEIEITPCADFDGDSYDTCDTGMPGDDGKPRDCDDDDETIYPGANESCDGKDNDCDESTADGTSEPWFGAPCDGPDNDQCLEGKFICSSGEQTCDDNTGDSVELCDSLDNDCNPSTADGAAEPWFGAPCDGSDSDLCSEGDFICSSGAQICNDNTGDNIELCDGSDNDCNPSTADGAAESWIDAACDGPDSDQCLEGAFICSEGLQACNDDTGDTIEICDGQDNNCNGEIDEGFTLITYYRDVDSDGYGDPLITAQACSPPPGYVEDNSDCDDSNETIHPGIVEASYGDPVCDDKADNDCDGLADIEDNGCQYLIENLLLPADPDPCDQVIGLCESASMGPYTVISTPDETGVSTIASDENGDVLYIDWFPAGDFVDLVVTLHGYPALEPIPFESGIPTLRAANMFAGIVLGLGPAPLEELSFLQKSIIIDGNPLNNHAGCDVIDGPRWFRYPASCSEKGGCCDSHDYCINMHCTGTNDSGSVWECFVKQAVYLACLLNPVTPPSVCDALFPRCSQDCQQCHNIALGCFNSIFPTGPSICCSPDRNDCGKPQKCMILGDFPYVETNADKCKPPPGNGGGWGDPHLVTFDRLAYDFQGAGEYIMVRSLDDSFEIQARMSPWRNSRVVSINSAVAMNVNGDMVGVYLGRTPSLYVNGLPATLDPAGLQLPFGGQIILSPGGHTAIWPDNSEARVTLRGSYMNIWILIPDARKGRIEGLLGNFDDSRADELVTSEGQSISARPSFDELYKQYGESWRISQEQSLFDYINGNTTDTHTDRTFPGGFVTTAILSDSARQQAEQICRDAGVTDPVLLEACILDVGITGDPSFAGFLASVPTPEESVQIDGSLGHTIDHPAKSCRDIQQYGVVDGDRKYWIGLLSGVFEMHCNFSSDTGGWTQVGALDTSTGFCGNNSIPDLRVDPDASMGKVPDTDAQALMTQTPESPMEIMYYSRSDGKYVWHALESVTDFDTSSKHNSSSFYCTNWHCDNGTIDSSACGSEGQGCPVTAHGRGGFYKKIYVDSYFSRHIRGMHTNGNICGLPNYERARIWIYVR